MRVHVVNISRNELHFDLVCQSWLIKIIQTVYFCLNKKNNPHYYKRVYWFSSFSVIQTSVPRLTMLFILQRTDYILHRCGQYVRVSDDEVGDGFTFGNKQQLRVVNYILLDWQLEGICWWGIVVQNDCTAGRFIFIYYLQCFMLFGLIIVLFAWKIRPPQAWRRFVRIAWSILVSE